jgi:CspA family cold shock protein
MEGTVKTLVSEKGFGFIRSQDGSDWFFHRSGMLEDRRDFDELRLGDRVEFQTEQSPKGPRAVSVVRV